MRAILGLCFLLGICFCQAEQTGKTYLSFKDYPPARVTPVWGYGKCIVAFKEAPLHDVAKGCDGVYRLVYCPTFLSPLIVTIKKEKDSITIDTKGAGGHGGYGITGVAFQTKRKLTKHEWETFSKLLSKSNFWEMKQSNGRVCIDGTNYILECEVNGQYRYVCRDYFDKEDEPFWSLVDWMETIAPRKGCLETNDSDGIQTSLGFGIAINGNERSVASKGCP